MGGDANTEIPDCEHHPSPRLALFISLSCDVAPVFVPAMFNGVSAKLCDRDVNRSRDLCDVLKSGVEQGNESFVETIDVLRASEADDRDQDVAAIMLMHLA